MIWIYLLLVLVVCGGGILLQWQRRAESARKSTRDAADKAARKELETRLLAQALAEHALYEPEHVARQEARIKSMLPPNSRLTEMKRFGDYDADQRKVAVQQRLERALYEASRG